MLFATSYYDPAQPRNPYAHFGTTLFARNEKEAYEFMIQRNLGEVMCASNISRPTLTSEHLAQENFGEAQHASCWLGMLATASGVATGVELLRDTGVIHEIAHLACDALKGYTIKGLEVTRLVRRVEELEKLVPGMWPVEARDFLVKPQSIPLIEIPITASTARSTAVVDLEINIRDLEPITPKMGTYSFDIPVRFSPSVRFEI